MVSTALVTVLITTVAIFIRQILFAIGKGLCWIVGILTDTFEMVAGLENVTYVGGESLQKVEFIRIFFGTSSINTIYWGMALIGIVLCFGFAIFAVIRKMADSTDKVKHSLGDIIRNCFKGITIILLMNFIVTATLNITSTLLDRIDYLMTNTEKFDMGNDVTFDSEDYAAMARCLNTIGNYSLNASYNNRYNLNACYNDMRDDLKQLADDGKFDVTYITTTYDDDGNEVTVNSWQSVLQSIYRSVDDINVEQPLDEYNTKLADSLLEAMNIMKNDASFEALEKYHVKQSKQEVGEMIHLDRMIMLLGSMYGNGANLALGSGMTDYLRGPYYYGQKDIFSYDQVSKDFDMGIGTWLYLTVIIVAFLFIKEMLAMVFNAVARIFNMLLLYISAPPIIAVTPLDDGGKLKQWTTAFIIQSFGLFGTVIALRLVMIFMPILFSGDYQLFSSARADTFARVIIMYGAIYTARKASGMIVGILADNAGWQAISAGDVGNEARGAVESTIGYSKMVGGMAMGAVQKGLGLADTAVGKLGSAGSGGAKKGGGNANTKQGAKQPTNKIDTGSKTSAQQPPQTPSQPNNKANVASIGANGKGTIGGGTFETGSKGSASDFQSSSRLSLEPADPIKGGSSEAPDGRRPKLSLNDSASNSNNSNNSNNSSNSQNQGNGAIPPAPPLPEGAYGTVPKAPPLPQGAYGTGSKPNSAPSNNANAANQGSNANSVPSGNSNAANQGSNANSEPRQNPAAAQSSNNVNSVPQQNPAPAQRRRSNSAPSNNASAAPQSSNQNNAARQNPAQSQNNKANITRNRTFEDSAVSERRNRSIPESVRDRF